MKGKAGMKMKADMAAMMKKGGAKDTHHAEEKPKPRKAKAAMPK